MLFTRCPDCKTTFRITAEALSKAAGQVRCGRCACVFDAYAELREREIDPTEDTLAQPVAAARNAPGRTDAPPVAAQEPMLSPENRSDEPELAGSPGDRATGFVRGGAAEARNQPSGAPEDDAFDGLTVADVMTGIESIAVDKDDATTGRRAVDADDLNDTLDGEAPKAPAAAHASSPDWRLLPGPGAPRASKGWIIASIGAAIALGLQVTHYFRAEIAGAAVVGPMLQDAYALLGAQVTPHWDLEQYRIVDWVATAEPNANGLGSLKITARIQNQGPQSQPYPHVHVQLMDRWDSAVGSRVFEPVEYLSSEARVDRLMAPGATARAELDVVDPGPDAYGFELDVCVESAADRLRCSADAVFPSM